MYDSTSTLGKKGEDFKGIRINEKGSWDRSVLENASTSNDRPYFRYRRGFRSRVPGRTTMSIGRLDRVPFRRLNIARLNEREKVIGFDHEATLSKPSKLLVRSVSKRSRFLGKADDRK